MSIGDRHHETFQKMVFFFVFILMFALTIVWFVGNWFNQRKAFIIASAFTEAINQEDWSSIVDLIHSEEKQKLGLNQEKVKIIGENLIKPLWQRLGKASEIVEIENPFMPSTPEEEKFFRNYRFFQVMRDKEKGAIVLVTKTQEGWMVNYGMFIFTLLNESVEKGILSQNQVLRTLANFSISQIFIGQESFPVLPWR